MKYVFICCTSVNQLFIHLFNSDHVGPYAPTTNTPNSKKKACSLFRKKLKAHIEQ